MKGKGGFAPGDIKLESDREIKIDVLLWRRYTVTQSEGKSKRKGENVINNERKCKNARKRRVIVLERNGGEILGHQNINRMVEYCNECMSRV